LDSFSKLKIALSIMTAYGLIHRSSRQLTTPFGLSVRSQQNWLKLSQQPDKKKPLRLQRLFYRAYPLTIRLERASAHFREGWILNTTHLLSNTYNLTAVAVFVVVPYIQVNVITVNDGGFGIHDTGMTVTDKIGRNHFR